MRQSTSVRAAYTLTELLIVLLVIALLVSLTAGAVFQFIGSGYKLATESTIRKVYAKLNAQYAAVIDIARREQMDSVFPTNGATGPMDKILQITNGDVNFTRVIYIKLRLAQEFPMSVAELTSPPAGIPVKAAYSNLPLSSLAGKPYESSALLLAALRQTRRGVSLSADDLGPSVKTALLSNGSGGTTPVQYLVDGWGQPLRFFRWPTGCHELDDLCPVTTTANSTKVRDQEDPDGRLLSLTGANQTTFEGWCHRLHRNPDATANPPITTTDNPYAFYTVPVIASSGPDLDFGFDDSPTSANGPMSILAVSTSHPVDTSTDNIYSFRLVTPGARGN